jgi:RimJ/RimL family protein N-acetyltransferase
MDEAVAKWVAKRIPYVGAAEDFGPFVAFGVGDDEGRPIAGIVWHGWKPAYGNIELSAASDSVRWLNRRILAEIFAYPFGFLGCRRVTTLTPARNERAWSIDLRLGFKIEGRVRLGFGDDDMLVMGLLREEWLAGRFAPPPVVMKEAA